MLVAYEARGGEKLGNKLKIIRKAKDITIYQMAERTGLSPSYISNLENNQKLNPTKESMDKIAESLDTTVAELFY